MTACIVEGCSIGVTDDDPKKSRCAYHFKWMKKVGLA